MNKPIVKHCTISLDEVKPPRHLSGRKPDLELIRLLGAVHPLLVTPTTGLFKYRILSGEQWYDPYNELGITDIPATIVIGDDFQLDLTTASAKLSQRHDEIRTAQLVKRLLGQIKTTMLARYLGLKSVSINDLIKILELPNDILELIPEKLAKGVAHTLLNTDQETKRMAFAHLRQGKTLTAEVLTCFKHRRNQSLAPLLKRWLNEPYQPVLSLGIDDQRHNLSELSII